MRYLLCLLGLTSIANAQTYYNKTTIPPSWPPALISTGTLTLPGTYSGAGTVNQNFLGINGVVTGSDSTVDTYGALNSVITFTNFQKLAADRATPAFKMVTNFGGSGDVGGFTGFSSELNMTARTGNVGTGVFSNYVNGIFLSRALANDGGTATTPGNAVGNLWGLNSETRLFAAATYWHGAYGYEAGLGITTGASLASKVGVILYLTAQDNVDADYENSGFAAGKSASATSQGWSCAYCTGTYDGVWSMAPTGTIVGVMKHAAAAGNVGTTANGVDFSNVTFTGNAFASNAFAVDGSGNFTANSITTTGGGNAVINKNASTAATEIGDGSTSGTVTIGGGSNNVGINAATATIKGTTLTINENSSTNSTSIGTGTTSGLITIGGGSDSVTVNAATGTIKGTTLQINKDSSTNVTNIGTGTTSGTVTVGGGSDAVAVNGYTTTLAGVSTVTGSGVLLNNNSSTNTTGIGTGTTTGTVTIGGGSNAVTINSSAFTVTSATGTNQPVNLFNWGLPVAVPPSGFFQNNGVYIVGQAPSNSATLSVSGTSGSVTATFNAVTLLGTAADVGRVITICDGNCTATTASTYKYCAITVQSTTTVATCTLSGTLSGTGAFANNKLWISGTPATNATTFSAPLPGTFANIYLAFPVNVISAATATGIYYAICVSTTVCTVYNNALASGSPTIPVSPTAFSTTGPGAFTQTTASAFTLLTLSIPANSMGTEGALVFDTYALRIGNSNTLVQRMWYAGTQFAQTSAATTQWYGVHRSFRNNGATNAQIFLPTSGNSATDVGTINQTATFTALDTTQAQNVLITAQLTTSALDYFILLGGTIAANYSP